MVGNLGSHTKALPPLPSQESFGVPLMQQIMMRKLHVNDEKSMSEDRQSAYTDLNSNPGCEDGLKKEKQLRSNNNNNSEDDQIDDESSNRLGSGRDTLLAQNMALRAEITELKRAFIDNLHGKKRLVSGGQFRTIVQPQRQSLARTQSAASIGSGAVPTTPGSSSGTLSSRTAGVLSDEDVNHAPVRLVQHERDLQVAMGITNVLKDELEVARAELSKSKNIEDAYKEKVERQANMLALLQQKSARDTDTMIKLREQLKTSLESQKRLQGELVQEKKRFFVPRTSRAKPTQTSNSSNAKKKVTQEESKLLASRPKTAPEQTQHDKFNGQTGTTSTNSVVSVLKKAASRQATEKKETTANVHTAEQMDTHAEYLRVMLRRSEENLNATKNELHISHETIQKQEQEAIELQSRLTSAGNRLKELATKLASLEESEEDQVKKTSKLTQRVQELEAKSNKDEEILRHFEQEVYDLHGRLERALQEARAAELQAEALGRECEEGQAREKKLDKEMDHWKGRASSLDRIFSELLENKAALARVIEEKEELARSLKLDEANNQKSHCKIAEAKHEVAEMKKTLAETRHAYAELTAEHARLRRMLCDNSSRESSSSLSTLLKTRLSLLEQKLARAKDRKPPAPRVSIHVISPTIDVTVVKGKSTSIVAGTNPNSSDLEGVKNNNNRSRPGTASSMRSRNGATTASSTSLTQNTRGTLIATIPTDGPFTPEEYSTKTMKGKGEINEKGKQTEGSGKSKEKHVQCRGKVSRSAVKRCLEEEVLPKFLRIYTIEKDGSTEPSSPPSSGAQLPKSWVEEVMKSLQCAVESSLTRLYNQSK